MTDQNTVEEPMITDPVESAPPEFDEFESMEPVWQPGGKHTDNAKHSQQWDNSADVGITDGKKKSSKGVAVKACLLVAVLAGGGYAVTQKEALSSKVESLVSASPATDPAPAQAQPTPLELHEQIVEVRQLATATQSGQIAADQALKSLAADQIAIKTALANLEAKVDALSQQFVALDDRQKASEQHISDFGQWKDSVSKRLSSKVRERAPARVVAARATGGPATPAISPPFELLSVDSWNVAAYAAVRPAGSSDVKFVAEGDQFAGWRFDTIDYAGQVIEITARGVRLTLRARP